MKTPSPQEAAKTDWADREAKKLAGVEFFLPENISVYKERQIEKFKAALLEADKNGYERGRKDSGMYLCVHHDSPACKECIDRLREFEENAFLKKDEALLRECLSAVRQGRAYDGPLKKQLESRLAPSVRVSEGKP